jgi:hypothetical protein
LLSYNHLEKNHSNRPPINSKIISFVIENFRGNIIGSSNSGKQLFSSFGNILIFIFFFIFSIRIQNSSLIFKRTTQTKVRDFQVSLFINKNIIRLKISMNNVLRVNILDTLNNLSYVELGFLFIKNIFSY